MRSSGVCHTAVLLSGSRSLGLAAFLASLTHLLTFFILSVQEPLLGDDLFAGVAGSPAMSFCPTTFTSFPCLADEMEEQVKAMELDL